MTRTRFYVLRLCQAFGLQFKSRHAIAAANEAHLQQEAEEILGEFCWKELEKVEELSMEYWNLRKLSKEREIMAKKIDETEEVLTQAQSAKSEQIELVMESTKDLVNERDEVMDKSDRLSAERELIINEARSIKRRHDGTKAKLEVLSEEGKESDVAFSKATEDLQELKKRFKKLRTRRDELTEKIDVLEKEISEVNERIEERRSKIQEESAGNHGLIGDAHKDISQTRAKLGLLEQEMNTMFRNIGKFVVGNVRDPEISILARPHRGLISQIKILENSVEMNRHLSRR